MFSNPVTGRRFIFTEDSSDENEAAVPDPELTIAVLVFCVLGPFWLIYRLAEALIKKSAAFTVRVGRKTLLPGDSLSE